MTFKLTGFRHTGQNNLYFYAPYDRPFLIEDPYYAMMYTTVLHNRKYFSTSAPFQLINNKRRLVKLFWIPYSQLYNERLHLSGEEYYVCHNKIPTFILLPLRVHKDYKLVTKTFEIKSKEINDIQTFVFDYEIWHKIIGILNDENDIFIHPFVFLHDLDGIQYYAIQFLQPTSIEKRCKDCGAEQIFVYSIVNKFPITKLKCRCLENNVDPFADSRIGYRTPVMFDPTNKE